MYINGLTFAAFLSLAMALPSHALTHKYPCDELIYDALTVGGGKRLQLCKSLDQINYNFGSRNGASELDVLMQVTTTLLYPEEEILEMYRGNYSYTLVENRLVVTVDTDVLSVIEMQKPFVNKIVERLLPYGVPVQN